MRDDAQLELSDCFVIAALFLLIVGILIYVL